MDRTELGRFGANLSQGELAQALAGWCAWLRNGSGPSDPGVDEVEKRLLHAPEDGILELSAWGVQLIRTIQPRADTFVEAWRKVVAQRPQGLRVEVHSGVGDDEYWLARQLLHPDVGARSVYQRQDEPAWPVAWEWPLRLGLLGPPRSAPQQKLRAALANVRHSNLWKIVDMQQPGAECELLLLPGDVRQSLKDTLDAPQRPRADCAIVLSARQLSAGRSFSLAGSLRREARTSGVALLSAGMSVDLALSELVAELSHDKPLDVALFDAVRNLKNRHGVSVPEPELLCSRSLVVHSSVRLTAVKFARHFSPAPVVIPLTPAGIPAGAAQQSTAQPRGAPLETGAASDPVLADSSRALQDLVRNGQWKYESIDASQLVDIRRNVEIARGIVLRAPRAESATAVTAPQPVAEPDQREVLTQIVEAASGETTKVLRTNQRYRLRVRIDHADAEWVGTGTAFPVQELPPSESVHTLDVSYVPLAGNANGVIEPPQHATLLLPADGASSTCEFAVSSEGLAAVFHARLVVSHQNRVLQTLRIDGMLDADQPQPYRVAVENLVQQGFHNLAYHQAFDAALVVNHSVEGQPGITALVGTKVNFVQPQGLAQAIQALQDTLTDHTALQTTETSLDAPALGKLIYGLMKHGRLLFDYVEPVIGTLDHDAGRIQMVEARAGAAFPVEYLYPLEVPPEQPPLCPNAKGALVGDEGATSHQDCPHRDDPEHMCPLRFWGFRKQVERQPAGVIPSETPGDVTTLAVPSPLNGKLDLLRCAQVARSEKVQAADYDPPKGLLKVLQDNCASVQTPASWTHWRDSVLKQSPGMLVLLSHTDRDEESNLPALEISKDKLPVASIESSYVKGPAAEAPVVFLLGCDTADPNFGFINFVERFKRKQAALVVGTLSTISARRAARFLGLALPLLKQAQGSGRTFGEVFLQIKRAALADGDGFALALVAYGDSSWQL